MKQLTIAVIGLFVFASVSVQAQTKTNNSKKSRSTSSVEQQENPVSEFKKRNKDVRSIRWKQGNLLIIEKINGNVERYNLEDAQDVKKAESLYGELPPIPPPPPPVPPPPPAPPVSARSAPSVPAAPPTPTVPSKE